jgi:hypothetical protein
LLDELAELVSNAKALEIWKHLTDGEGKPFTSWTGYVKVGLTGFEPATT